MVPIAPIHDLVVDLVVCQFLLHGVAENRDTHVHNAEHESCHQKGPMG